MNKKLKSIGCAVSLCLLAGSTLAANKANQISHAHYGLPNVIHLGSSSVNAIPLVITNNTNNTYKVKMTQASGYKIKMDILPVKQYPDNVISIDNPSWPVEVEIPQVKFDKYIYPDQPYVNINPKDHAGNGQPTVRVSHTSA